MKSDRSTDRCSCCRPRRDTVRADDWKLVWSDEFDEPGLPDPANGTTRTGLLRNNERQYYTRARKENARVENGMLVIEAQEGTMA